MKSATSFVENMKITNAEIFTSAKHCVGASASSVAVIIPSPKEHQKVLPCTTRSHEKEVVVQPSCVADNEPHIDDVVNNASAGLSIMAR